MRTAKSVAKQKINEAKRKGSAAKQKRSVAKQKRSKAKQKTSVAKQKTSVAKQKTSVAKQKTSEAKQKTESRTRCRCKTKCLSRRNLLRHKMYCEGKPFGDLLCSAGIVDEPVYCFRRGGSWKCAECGIYLKARQYLAVHRVSHCRARPTVVQQQDSDSEDEGRPRRSASRRFYLRPKTTEYMRGSVASKSFFYGNLEDARAVDTSANRHRDTAVELLSLSRPKRRLQVPRENTARGSQESMSRSPSVSQQQQLPRMRSPRYSPRDIS